jgi:hypothetical protein
MEKEAKSDPQRFGRDLINEEKATRLGMMTQRDVAISAPCPARCSALLVTGPRDFQSLISFKENIGLYDDGTGKKKHW